jgi:hypothetical protein
MAKLARDSLLTELRGAIGKQIVLKKYSYGTVVSVYPDMSRVKSSELQRLKQGWFAEAVKYAQSIVRDPQKKKLYAEKIRKGQTVYNYAIREFLENKTGFMRKNRG